MCSSFFLLDIVHILIIEFLYARHLTDVLWYGAVRPSVRSVVHNPCGQDIVRTIWPRMLKLSMYTLYGQSKKPIYFQGQRSNFKVTAFTKNSGTWILVGRI